MSSVDSLHLGPYRLVECLGSGAMGSVWLAEDEQERRRVAIKLLAPELVGRKGFLTRFEREADAGSRVVHPNVVPTLGAEFRFEGAAVRCFLVMEYVEGRTLRALAEDLGGQVPEALVREIGRQVAAGLAAIHAAGLVHRDLKPENVMITPDHTARIMDLGVAKHLGAERLTQEGQFAGSLAYAAPEQFGGRELTGAADLYALGVVLLELLTGENPFLRPTSGAVVEAHLREEAPAVTDRAPDATPFATEVVRTLLAKDPAKRFASAAELEATLAAGESSAWWRAHEDEGMRRRAGIPRVPVRRETELHGRADDLAFLRDAWERSKAGGGNTVLVTGEAGIGKSRLVDAFLSDLRSAEVHVLYGSHPPFGGNAVAEAVVAKLGHDGLEAKLRDLLAESPLLAPPLAAWLRHEPPPAGAISLAGDALAAALVQVMRGLARDRPVVLVVEDLHFADADARKVVLSLARAVEGHRVLLLLTTRPEIPAEDLAQFDRIESLRRTGLERLGAREVMLLLRDALRNERLAEKLGVKVAIASDGNPFFVFEMIRGLRQGQLITQLPDGTWVETKVIDQIPVPPAVRDLVEVRLSDLPQEKRAILDLGAVQGFEFEADLVAAALGRKPIDVLQDLAEVERRSGVVRAVGRRHRFDHHQIQEVVYAALSEPLREECHAAIAEAMERRAGAAEKEPKDLDGALCADLAEHLLRGRRGARAARYVLPGALEHSRCHRGERSIGLLDRALDVPGVLTGRVRWRALVHQAAVARLAGWRDRERRAIDAAMEVARSIGDRAAEAWTHSTLGLHLYLTGRLDEALVAHRFRLAYAREVGDPEQEGIALGGIGCCLESMGRLQESWDHHTRHLEIVRTVGPRHQETLPVGNLGMLAMRMGRYDQAREYYALDRKLCLDAGDLWGRGVGVGNEALLHFLLGEYDEALACADEQIRLATCVGDPASEVRGLLARGGVLRSLGRLGEAADAAARCLAITREIGSPALEADAHLAFVRVRLELGDRAGTRAASVLAADAARRAREPRIDGYLSGCLAAIAVEDGDDEAALRHIDAASGTQRTSEAPLERAEWGLDRARILVRIGRAEEGRALFVDALQTARRLGLRPLEWAALCALARLPGGAITEAESILSVAEPRADCTTRMECRVTHWLATGDRAHLAAAKRVLDILVEHAPPEHRASVLANVRLHREIADAARAAGCEVADRRGEPPAPARRRRSTGA